MRVLSRCVAVMVFVGGILAALIAGVAPAGAQCGMMGGGGSGGHDHAAMQGDRPAKPTGAEKRLRKDIDRVLSDERGRALLADALLNDRAFMEGLIQRLVAMPEWRAMATRQLAVPGPSGAEGRDPRVTPNSLAVVYACPMHPDVTSSDPGDCPKCGMALVRRESPRQ